MSEQSDVWQAVEGMAKRWQDMLWTDQRLIPLTELRPLWQRAVGARLDPRERLRLETHAHENLLLKAENHRLRRALEQATGAARVPASERRRTERRRAN